LCKRVAQSCARLFVDLETAGRYAGRYKNVDLWREAPVAWLPADRCLALARNLLKHPDPPQLPDGVSLRFGGSLRIGDMLGLLTELGDEAAWQAKPSSWSLSTLESYTGRLDPPVVYFQHVLWLWEDVFGGKLTFWRNAEGEPTGKLARYFFAVMRPVMGGEAPSAESLRDIIERQKAFSRWLDDSTASSANDRAKLAHHVLVRDALDVLVSWGRVAELARGGLSDGGGDGPSDGGEV
jgi:hypothetical protein